MRTLKLATLLALAIFTTQTEAATKKLTFEATHHSANPIDFPDPFPGFEQFVIGEIIYDDEAPVTTDLTFVNGPTYRQFDAIKSFTLTFADPFGFKLGDTAAGAGLENGEATVRDYAFNGGFVFDTDAFAFGPCFRGALYIEHAGPIAPGIDQLTQDFIDSKVHFDADPGYFYLFGGSGAGTNSRFF